MAKRRNRKRSGGIARDDYTQGGRVGYREGGSFEYDQISGLKNQQAYDPVAVAKAQQDAAEAAAKKAEEEAAAKAAEEAKKAAEEAKKAELRQSIDDAATGKVPESAVIDTPTQAGIDPVTGQPLPEQKITTMAAPTTVTHSSDPDDVPFEADQPIVVPTTTSSDKAQDILAMIRARQPK